MGKCVLLIVGIVIGIILDRINLREVMKDKDKEVEKLKQNFNLLGEWLAMYERAECIEEKLVEMEINTIGIYGMGVLGNHLYRQLENTSVKVNYIIDRNDLKGVYTAKIIKPCEHMENTDAVIVTPVYQFNNIKKDILQHNDIQVVSLKEILNAERKEDE